MSEGNLGEELNLPAAADPPFEPILCERRVTSSLWNWLGGIGLILVAIVGFVVSIFSKSGQFERQGFTTLPMLLAIGLIATAIRNRKIPASVLLDQTGLTLADGSQIRHIPWDDIVWNEETQQPLTNRKISVLYDRSGSAMLKLPAVYTNFDQLVLALNRGVKASVTDVTEKVRIQHLRRRSWLLLAMGVLFMGLCVVTAISSRRADRNAERLRTEAVPGSATIVRLFTAPNGFTRRAEYRVDAKRPDGTDPDVKNIEIEPDAWSVMTTGQKIAVRYVPGDPDLSQPFYDLGQHEANEHIPMLLIICMGIFSLLLILFGILHQFGIDVVKDSETKKWRVAHSAK